MEACTECGRLLKLCLDASQELAQAQSELARYRTAQDNATFHTLWGKCHAAMRTSQTIRAEMSQHYSSHATGPARVKDDGG